MRPVWGSADERSDRVYWTDLGRSFGGDARRLADVVGVSVLRDDALGPRDLFYVPPRRAGGHGVAVLPAQASPEQTNGMIAMACGLHLSRELRYSLYVDGALIGPQRARHRRASVFARCFLRGAAQEDAQRVG